MARNAVFYVATMIGYETVYADLVTRIEHGTRQLPVTFADTSYEALKSRVEARVRQHPDERYLILSGYTIAEIDHPPVRFRTAS